MFNFVQLYIALFYVLIFTSPYNVYIRLILISICHEQQDVRIGKIVNNAGENTDNLSLFALL